MEGEDREQRDGYELSVNVWVEFNVLVILFLTVFGLCMCACVICGVVCGGHPGALEKGGWWPICGPGVVT